MPISNRKYFSTALGERTPEVNNFCLTISSINGSGSTTANIMLQKTFFKMGIPVSGNNILPSNIQGLPTWYSIRVNKDGYLGRVSQDDIIVSMNQSTIDSEINFLVPGGALFYADDIKLATERQDVTLYPMPVKKIIKATDTPAHLRDYLANMVYVGILTEKLGIDKDTLYQVIEKQFKGKQNAIDANWSVIIAAAEWASANLEKKDPYFVETMPELQDYIMVDGNTASALGSIYGGVQFTAWYPITPATGLAEALIDYLPGLRTDPESNKATYAVVQAEDELAAIGMAIGAGWGGLRSMTSTSGPGLSLMAEYLGLAYYAEVPVVVWDVQRVGPSTGLPTRTGQCDLTFANFISHGDKDYILLIPGDVNECFRFGWEAFDLAEVFQTPVIILTDLDLGMNVHLTRKFDFPDKDMNRGKVLWEEDLEKMLEANGGSWGRYVDVDGDGIPYRTLPGNKHPSAPYFARGTGHNELARYSEDPIVWERVLDRIKRKFVTNRHLLPKPMIDENQASIGIIGYGSTESAIQEARDILISEGVKTDFLRIRSLPFCDEVGSFIENHKRNYVVELNRDGQMRQLLSMHYPENANTLIQTSHMDGMGLTAHWVVDRILSKEMELK